VRSVSRPGVWSCVLAALLFGASTPAASVLAQDLTPLALAGLLYVGAALAMAPWWVSGRPDVTSLRRDWRLVAVAVVTGGAIGPALLTAGLVDTPAATASLLLNLELVATVVLAATLFREHLGRNMITAAILVSAAGVLLVWEPGAAASGSALFIVGACVAWGIDNCATSQIDQIAPQHVTFLKGAMAGSVNLLLALAVTGLGTVTAWSLLGALAVGALGYGASITLWVRGAQQVGAARGQVIFAAAPFLGAIISWVVLTDPVEPAQVAAMVVASTGIGFSLRSSHLHRHEHDPLEHLHEHGHADDHHDHPHDEAVPGRHSHLHEHRPLVHAHPHVPDLHHRHHH
jgi:drug/metabolite transporter (DMT)-like permease